MTKKKHFLFPKETYAIFHSQSDPGKICQETIVKAGNFTIMLHVYITQPAGFPQYFISVVLLNNVFLFSTSVIENANCKLVRIVCRLTLGLGNSWSLWACLHRGEGPQVSEVTHLGWVNPPVHIISHMVTPPIM